MISLHRRWPSRGNGRDVYKRQDVVLKDKEWIPGDEGTSLYIRPTMVGDDGFLGIKPSKKFTFFVVLSPVGPYYKEGFNPIPIYVEEQLVRAVVGGVGDIKTGGNYACLLYTSRCV